MGSLGSQRGTLTISAGLYTTGNGDLTDMEIYYKLCRDGNCFFTGEEAGGVGQVEKLQVTRQETKSGDFTQEAVETSFDYQATILHEPQVCSGASECKYVFSTFNPSVLSTPRQATLLVSLSSE